LSQSATFKKPVIEMLGRLNLSRIVVELHLQGSWLTIKPLNIRAAVKSARLVKKDRNLYYTMNSMISARELFYNKPELQENPPLDMYFVLIPLEDFVKILTELDRLMQVREIANAALQQIKTVTGSV